MRVTATVPGCDTWIEFTDVWSRVDLRNAANLDGQPFLDFLATKIVACRIDTTGGEPITTPADLSVMENIDRLDLRLVEFLGQALMTAGTEMFRAAKSGFFCVPLSPASEIPEEPATTP